MNIKTSLIAALLATSAAWVQAQTVTVQPPAATVTVGDTFSLDVVGKGFADKIFGGGYTINFDATRLVLDSITIDTSVWELGGPAPIIDNALGTAIDVNFNTLMPKGGDFLTAVLNFTAKAAGPATVSLTEDPAWPFGNEAAEAVPVTFSSATFTVAAVPEPESVLLGLAGLSILALRLRRRQG